MVIEGKLKRVEQKNKLFQDDLLNTIHQRNDIINKINDFIQSSIPLYDNLIEGVFLDSIKNLQGYSKIVNSLKSQFESGYKNLNKKYHIEGDIDQIDKNLYFTKLDILPKLLSILTSEDHHLPDELYAKLNTKQKIASFSILENNWDSYGALRVSKIAIKNALVFFDSLGDMVGKVCFVYPTIDGKVGIDFKNSKYRIEVKLISLDNIDTSILNNKKILIKSKHFKTSASLITFLKKNFHE